MPIIFYQSWINFLNLDSIRYLIKNKKADIILGKFKEFIRNYGKPNSCHTDNGKSFQTGNSKFFLKKQYKTNIRKGLSSSNIRMY